MSLKQRATQCSGYIPPSQYVPAYSRPLRSSNSRWHDELSPITPKPSFDDPHDTRTRSIHEAVKVWLASSPNSVIGRGTRSPSDSPRSSGSSFDRANFTPSDMDFDRTYTAGNAESPTFQGITLATWTETPENWERGTSHMKSDANLTPTQGGSLSSVGHLATKSQQFASHHIEGTTSTNLREREEKEINITSEASLLEHVQASYGPSMSRASIRGKDVDAVIAAAVIASIGPGSGTYVEKSFTGDLDSTAENPQRALEVLLKPPRGLKNPVVHEGDEMLSHKEVSFDIPVVTPDESASPLESGDPHKVEIFPFPVLEERRFGDDGMNESKLMKETSDRGEQLSRVAPGSEESGSKMDSSTLAEKTNIEADYAASMVVEKSREKRRTMQPSIATDGVVAVGCRQVDTKQTSSDPQSRIGLVSSAQLFNGGKREGPTKNSAVVPEESHHNINVNRRELLFSPSEVNRKEFTSTGVIMEKVKRDKFYTKAAAWEEAKNSKFLSRYKREESKIIAWEDQKKAQAAVNMKKVEMKLQEKRAKAIEKMQNEMAKAHKQAVERKAIAEAKRAEKAAKAAEEAEIIRRQGRRPLSLFCF